MEYRQVKEQFETGRIQLTAEETFKHYFLLLPILFLCKIFFLTEPTIAESIAKVSIWEWGIAVTVIGYFIYHKYTALAFKKYRLQHTSQDFRLAATATAIELNWEIVTLTDTALVAEKSGSLWGAGRTRITIIREGEKIYSNSILVPSINSSHDSLGWNTKNLQVFNNNLVYAVRGEDVIGKAKIAESAQLKKEEAEWHSMGPLTRIALFFIVLIVAVIGTFSILSGGADVIFILLGVVFIGYLIMKKLGYNILSA